MCNIRMGVIGFLVILSAWRYGEVENGVGGFVMYSSE